VISPILPGAAIGVLGSGQLGRMFAIAARRMGYRVHTFSPDADTPTGQVADLEVIAPYDDLDAVLTTNIKGVVYTVQKALPHLNNGASIILTGSTTAERGRAGLGIYAATKAAVRALARTWANELADRGIRVNVVIAGSTATPGSDNLALQTDPGGSVADFRANRTAAIPLGRFAEADEIANAAVFLASDLSSFTTGSAVTADGGANQV